ncbi:MAG: hypothetical protein WA350_08620 [Candidatus Sulfotelmatobacter sp.]
MCNYIADPGISQARRSNHAPLEGTILWTWIAWGLVLAAVSVIAFGRDILPFLPRLTRESDRH